MSEQKPRRISVMFVCLGNICRSPMAQAVFQHLVKEKGLDAHFDKIESCGTGGYHVGEEPDDRTVAKCREKGVPINSLAQVLETRDFHEFDYLLGMDENNVRNIKYAQPKDSKATVKLFGEYGDGKSIQDPYYGGKGDFKTTYKQVLSYSEGLLKELGLLDA